MSFLAKDIEQLSRMICQDGAWCDIELRMRNTTLSKVW